MEILAIQNKLIKHILKTVTVAHSVQELHLSSIEMQFFYELSISKELKSCYYIKMQKAKINIIAAVAKNNVIGANGNIPWDLKEDRIFFKKKTLHHPIIMGRKTFESIGCALPKRLNIVISATKKFSGPNLVTASTFEEALKIAGRKKVFVIGGQSVYQKAIPLAKKIYLTEINADFEGDTIFPDFNKSLYKRKVLKSVKGEISYQFVEYKKKMMPKQKLFKHHL